MTDIFDLVEASEPSDVGGLRELRLGTEPATILLFTSDGDEIALHWEPAEDYHTYVRCPGPNCPLCYMGSEPTRQGLLPAYNLESRAVEILRLPLRKGVGSLLSLVTPLLKRPDIASTVVLLSRHGNEYRVLTRPSSAPSNAAALAIARFQADRTSGLALQSVFVSPTAAELAEIPRVRLKLDAIGGYPPDKPSAS